MFCRKWWPLVAAFCFPLRSASQAAEPLQLHAEGAHYVGAAGCKSSSCHGGAGEKRSQFITWTRQDFHNRAYAILTNARSARMAESLGLAAAQSSSRCTICHAPFQAIDASRLTSGATPAEGVSCESCHGPAEPWLRGHTRPDWTYATRIGAGMRDLKSFYVRANTCVACHQNLESDIAAAGHPRLLFEMDRQSNDEPKHWRDPEGAGPRAWLVGQAVALRETSWRLAQEPNGNASALESWEALHWLLAKVTAVERSLPPIRFGTARDSEGFTQVQQEADALAKRASQQNFGSEFTPRLLRGLVEDESEFAESFARPPDLLFRRAQRLFFAIESLGNKDPMLEEALRLLRDDLHSDLNFQPKNFAAHLANIRSSLTSAD